MNILTMLWKNLWGGSRTMLFPARPKVSEHYRGLVRFDPALCSGCAVCKMRCTARAIEFKAGKGVPSPKQIHELGRISHAGGISGVAYSVAEAIGLITAAPEATA